jgi:hypothetical protein
MTELQAEGWYEDPYGIHHDRWMSAGQPTKLVRDGATESYDPPPDLPLPETLVPVAPVEPTEAPDLRRADDAGDEPSDPGDAFDAAASTVLGKSG